MPRLIWSPSALDDVARLHAFLLEKNRPAAARAIKAIRHGVKLLGVHPEAGRLTDELPPDFRQWPIDFGDSGYVALYRYDGRQVTILAARHARELGY